MLFRQLGLGRADAPSYRDKEAPRRQQDQSKTTWKDTRSMRSQNWVCAETKVNQRTLWWRLQAFIWWPPTTTQGH